MSQNIKYVLSNYKADSKRGYPRFYITNADNLDSPQEDGVLFHDQIAFLYRGLSGICKQAWTDNPAKKTVLEVGGNFERRYEDRDDERVAIAFAATADSAPEDGVHFSLKRLFRDAVNSRSGIVRT